ncbi:MAG TPA: GNAT family N-acetyltransferase [Woeseiaceae bacterium]|nr:GNAT family N-acetyltransferase [Woeseiaceae bacterium]
MRFELRDVTTSDLAAILELNQSVIPAVNSLTLENLRWFLQNAFYFRLLADAAGLGAFLIGLRPGTDYGSLNYRWFCQRYDDFAYVDRVAVSPRARRLGLASMLYDDVRAALPDDVWAMTCEVNLRPPNDGSLRYHQQRGFRQVGSQETEGGNKEVALMLLDLTRGN